MQISAKYVVVKKFVEPKAEGFGVVEVADSFIYKGQIVELPGEPVYVSNRQLIHNDIILFTKYSPDTVEMDLKDEKVKFVKRDDILAVL